MAYTNSPLATYTKLSPNQSWIRTHAIDRISPHCVVGQTSIESLGNWFAQPAAQASSNYGIDKDGRIGLFVPESNRSWCTSSAENDQRAVTIECASDTFDPYRMNDCVYQSLITLCADICRRNGKRKLLWIDDKSKALAYEPKSDEMLITVHRWFANKSCIPVDSEVLTRSGWVKLSDIQVGDEIACADLDNLRISFEEVYDKVPERYQDTYTNNGFTATKDHRCVYRIHEQNFYRIEDYKHLLASGTCVYLPMAGRSDFEGFKMTDEELRLLIATQADGHYMHERWGGSDHYTGVQFHLKKRRKIERIKELLDACHYEYTESTKSDGSVSVCVWGGQAVENSEKYLHEKCFDWNWLSLSPHQADVFLKEILFWDGCEATNLYTSSQKINLDVVSAIAAINGTGSNVSGSNVVFRQSPYTTLGLGDCSTKRNSKQHKSAKTKVSCVSVKTGIFLARQNGKTFITGNCPGDWLYSRLGDLAAKVTALLQPMSIHYRAHVQSYGWLDAVADGVTSGTTGEGKRLEAVKITPPDGWELEVSVHLQGIGDKVYKGIKKGKSSGLGSSKTDPIIGSVGEGRRMEAIRIHAVKKTGSGQLKYRVHMQGIGWGPWCSDNQWAGTKGEARRIEAIQIKIA